MGSSAAGEAMAGARHVAPPVGARVVSPCGVEIGEAVSLRLIATVLASALAVLNLATALAAVVKIDGRWRFPVSEFAKDIEGDIDSNLRETAARIKTIREVTAEVAGGKLKTASQARTALDKRAMEPPGATSRNSAP